MNNVCDNYGKFIKLCKMSRYIFVIIELYTNI